MAVEVEPGHAMQLRTDSLILTVVEHDAEHVSVTVERAQAGLALVEPFVTTGPDGIRVDLEARR